MKQRCSYLKRDGRACNAWAMKKSEPPVCAPHGGRGVGAPRGNQNRRTHGLYRRKREEGAALDPATRAFSLQDEIGVTRVVLRWLVRATPPDSWDVLPLAVNLRVHGCINTSAMTIGRLVRTEQKIRRMQLAQGEDVFQDSTEFLNEAMRRRQSFYMPGQSLGEALDSAGDFSLMDEIAHTRVSIKGVMTYWGERDPDVKEMVTLWRRVIRGVNQVRRLFEAQLALMDSEASKVFDAIVQAMEDEGAGNNCSG